MVLFSMTMSVEALESKTINRQNSLSANADWTKTTPEGLSTDNILSVTKSDAGTDIYISICTYDQQGNWSCKSGYMFTQDNVFSIDKKLDSASLNAVKIDLYQWNCDITGNCVEIPAGTSTIEAAWTGKGKVLKSSYNWRSKSGNFISKSSGSSSVRDATAKGSLTVDDLITDLGTSDSAGLAQSKSSDMYIQK